MPTEYMWKSLRISATLIRSETLDKGIKSDNVTILACRPVARQ
jgi:hypothetical protein